MKLTSDNFSSIQQMSGQLLQHAPKAGTSKTDSSELSFQGILKGKQEQRIAESESLRFSKHANERLLSRNIDLSAVQLERLQNGTNKAREKGINESLVMVDNLAFIVNVRNNVVVTAVNDTEDAVFTNIDGAVIG